MRVYLVDGTYELFRMYFGAPSFKTADGREAGAARALYRSLKAFIERESITHIAYAFDHVIESFRNDLYPGYKTGDGIDPDLRSQFEFAEDVTRALGVTTWPMVEFEADDAIATAAASLESDPQVEQVLICANDKDLAQCVRGERVVMYDRFKRVVMNETDVIAKFGVPPKLIPDWLALVGDAADGYPGIPTWGKKSAALALTTFGGVESIPGHLASWPRTIRGAARLHESLVRRRDEALLYRTLATLRRDAPIDTSSAATARSKSTLGADAIVARLRLGTDDEP